MGLAMKKLKSGLYKYKFALITKERPSVGKLIWRCHMPGAIRNFLSRSDAKRYVDDIEVDLVSRAKLQQSCHEQPFETYAITRSGFLYY